MPLLKLWNSLTGRSAGKTQPAAEETAAAPPVVALAVDAQDGQAAAARGTAAAAGSPEIRRTSPAARTVAPEPVVAETVAAKPARRILPAGRRSPHAALCKMLRPLKVARVLEIQVGDGTRAGEVLSTLSAAMPDETIRYVAIDLFEMGDATITLKDFHRQLREQNVRPQLYPETIERGLIRVAHTIGSMDLVLIAAPASQWCEPRINTLLARITHAESTILRLDGETWTRHSLLQDAQSSGGWRRAA